MPPEPGCSLVMNLARLSLWRDLILGGFKPSSEPETCPTARYKIVVLYDSCASLPGYTYCNILIHHTGHTLSPHHFIYTQPWTEAINTVQYPIFLNSPSKNICRNLGISAAWHVESPANLCYTTPHHWEKMETIPMSKPQHKWARSM